MKPCIVDMFQCSYFVGEAEVGKEGALCIFMYVCVQTLALLEIH